MTAIQILNNVFFAYFYSADEWLQILWAGGILVLILWFLLRFLKDA